MCVCVCVSNVSVDAHAAAANLRGVRHAVQWDPHAELQSDGAGAANRSLLMRACRDDGVLLRADKADHDARQGTHQRRFHWRRGPYP